jgi:hypothetical protein
MKNFFLVLAVSLACSVTVAAPPARDSPQSGSEPSANASGVSRVSEAATEREVVETRETIEAEIRRVDALISEELLALQEKFEDKPEGVASALELYFERNQSHWVPDRESVCAIRAGLLAGGTPWYVVRQDECILQLAGQRLEVLKTLNAETPKVADDPEGDIATPDGR